MIFLMTCFIFQAALHNHRVHVVSSYETALLQPYHITVIAILLR